jgi:hypothetical protein
MNQAKFNQPPIPTDKDKAKEELDALLLEEEELMAQLNEKKLDNSSKQVIPGEVQPDEISHPIVLHDTNPGDSQTEENYTENPDTEDVVEPEEDSEVIQNNEELRKQLYEEMQKVIEIEKQLAQLDKENKELEEFIAKQEEMEKLEQLKKKAMEAIAKGREAGLSKKELLAEGFNAGDIDEVFNSKKK